MLEQKKGAETIAVLVDVEVRRARVWVAYFSPAGGNRVPARAGSRDVTCVPWARGITRTCEFALNVYLRKRALCLQAAEFPSEDDDKDGDQARSEVPVKRTRPTLPMLGSCQCCGCAASAVGEIPCEPAEPTPPAPPVRTPGLSRLLLSPRRRRRWPHLASL